MKRTRAPFIHIFILIAFLFNSFGSLPLAQAQELRLPAPGVMVQLSPEFNPPILKGVTVNPNNPFKFDFILDKGDAKGTDTNSALRPILGQELVSVPDIRTESTKLVKYFLAAITTSENDLWVNLSPYEKNRIIPKSFGQTDMGRDLLGEDYILKQITASLIYPEGETGKKFWSRVYAEAAKRYGSTNIPVNTFNKVWIVPDYAKVYEHANTAYVVKARLKVMLEEDYLALKNVMGTDTNSALRPILGQELVSVPNTHTLGSQIIRQIIIPELEKEVNEGKNFATLRQVYYSLILAVWFKKRMKDSILGRKYMDQNKVNGIHYDHSIMQSSSVILSGAKDLNKFNSIRDSSALPQNDKNVGNDIEAIYQHYLKAFKKGVYNYIKEEPDPVTQEMISKKYFSGGAEFNRAMITTEIVGKVDNAEIYGDLSRPKDFATVAVDLISQRADAATTVGAAVAQLNKLKQVFTVANPIGEDEKLFITFSALKITMRNPKIILPAKVNMKTPKFNFIDSLGSNSKDIGLGANNRELEFVIPISGKSQYVPGVTFKGLVEYVEEMAGYHFGIITKQIFMDLGFNADQASQILQESIDNGYIDANGKIKEANLQELETRTLGVHEERFYFVLQQVLFNEKNLKARFDQYKKALQEKIDQLDHAQTDKAMITSQITAYGEQLEQSHLSLGELESVERGLRGLLVQATRRYEAIKSPYDHRLRRDKDRLWGEDVDEIESLLADVQRLRGTSRKGVRSRGAHFREINNVVDNGEDEAMLTNIKGGIDLTAKRMKLEVAADKSVVSAVIDLKALENIEINGLYIKHIEIKPLNNLPEVLSVSAG